MWFIIIEQLNNDTLDRFILVYNSFNNKDTLDGCVIDTTYSKLRPGLNILFETYVITMKNN